MLDIVRRNYVFGQKAILVLKVQREGWLNI